MTMNMSDERAQAFIQKIGATAIANQAVLKCIVLGLPVTIDNVILCVGDFVDSANKNLSGLIGEVEKAIVNTIEVPAEGGATRHDGPGHI